LPQLAPNRRNQSLKEAAEAGETEEIEETEDNEEEEEVTHLLPTTANTASILHALNGSKIVKEVAEEEAVAPTPSVSRATALTPANHRHFVHLCSMPPTVWKIADSRENVQTLCTIV
jgi:hypothetical protein